ncbi:hypothetical protein D9M72_359850 [compost metagenome]
MPKRPSSTFWAAFGWFNDRVTEATLLRSSSPLTRVAGSQRLPSRVQGTGGAARMPWALGEVEARGTSRVWDGPAGSATWVVRSLPSVLSMATSRVMAQSCAFWMRRLMASALDQSQLPLCGVRRRLGFSAALKVSRRRISPLAEVSAVTLGKVASWVITCTESSGRTKLNRVSAWAARGIPDIPRRMARTRGRLDVESIGPEFSRECSA